MIIRQFAVRHGRSAIVSSVQCGKRTYAASIKDPRSALSPDIIDNEPVKVIPGHPSDTSSILDQSHLPPTRVSREAAEHVSGIIHEISTLQGEVNAFAAAVAQRAPSEESEVISEQPPVQSKAKSRDLDAFYKEQQQQRRLSNLGSKLINVYDPKHIINNPPKIENVTLSMLLANQTHLGHATALWHPGNSSYIFGIRDGIHIISLDITLAYLRRATKVVREVARRGGIIIFVGTRKGQQDIMVNAAKIAGGYHIFDRWIGGTLTNGQQVLERNAMKVVDNLDREIVPYRPLLKESSPSVIRPDLVVCLNPLENRVCLHECGSYNVPTIGVIDTDANPSWVTYPIPANDDSLRSIALIAGTLGRAAREGQQLRLEAAKRGESTFDSKKVQNMLERMAELAQINVKAEDQGDAPRQA